MMTITLLIFGIVFYMVVSEVVWEVYVKSTRFSWLFAVMTGITCLTWVQIILKRM